MKKTPRRATVFVSPRCCLFAWPLSAVCASAAARRAKEGRREEKRGGEKRARKLTVGKRGDEIALAGLLIEC